MSHPVTRAIFTRMDSLCREAGTRLVVLMLDAPPEYVELFEREGILAVDGSHEGFGQPGFTVPGESHPNELLNAYWAELLTTELRPLLREP